MAALMDPLERAKSEFLKLVAEIGNHEQTVEFFNWIKDEMEDEVLNAANGYATSGIIEKRMNLTSVANYCRSMQPNFEAIFPSEQLSAPVNSTEGLNFQNTAHVDAFLYDNSEVEDLTEGGKIPTHYCKVCPSRDIGEIEVMSHSMGRDELEYIFDTLLPDLNGKTVLDIGSRIGAVLYGAYIFSGASKIIGVEMNPDLCNVAGKALQQFQMLHRVQLVNAELSTRPDLLQESDVIILHNVFDWFAPIDVQVKLWQLVKANVKSGSIIVTVPSLENALEILPDNAGINLNTWVKPAQAFNKGCLTPKERQEIEEQIFMYFVL